MYLGLSLRLQGHYIVDLLARVKFDVILQHLQHETIFLHLLATYFRVDIGELINDLPLSRVFIRKREIYPTATASN